MQDKKLSQTIKEITQFTKGNRNTYIYFSVFIVYFRDYLSNKK